MRSLLSAFAGLAFVGCVTTSDDPRPSAEQLASQGSQDVASSTPDLCATLAAELTGLLSVAQSCNVAAANPFQCASWVPSIDGCSQPVANPQSDAVKAYLEVFEKYAASCPLPDRPCVDPSTLGVDCAQSPDVDSTAGRCTILEK